ncbi:BON domain-containing protein [Phenylobacterium sp.]|uniref:BON domain-containing protein n=1 Tax=Phenylobacterium sp. TaxID=1871053 RepID=UPI0035B1E9B1
MADRWMDERDRQMRDRDWRRSESYGRGGDYGRDDDQRGGREDYRGGYDFDYRSRGEGRSFGAGDDEFGARFEGPDRDRVFGERETGENYTRGTGMSSGGGTYGGGDSYGRGAGGGRSSGYQGRSMGGGGGGRGGDWQDRDYQGTSPAFRTQDQGAVHGRDWQGRDYGGPSPAFRNEDYTRGGQDYSSGGRYYGDDDRQPIYREEYGMGGREYGKVPGGYDARREGFGGGRQSYGGGYGADSYGQAYADRGDYRQGNMRPAYGGTASGGTGGYDFERGYGDGGRQGDDRGGGRDPMDRAGDFLSRAGQKISNWFRGDSLMEGSRGDEPRGFREDYGRDWRMEDRGHRGRGPKGYKRSNERISEEVHERLADDSWLDASNIDVKVEGGEVTLSGTVENRQAKHRAERLVEDISGVDHVQNNLRVASNPVTGSGSGFGDSATETLMSRDGPATGAGNTGQDSASTRTTTRRT